MANMGSEIIIRPELRPCKVRFRGEIKKALFHKWMAYGEIVQPSLLMDGHKGGQLQCGMAIIEFEDGVVTTVYPWEIKFLDNAFSEYAWPEEDADGQ